AGVEPATSTPTMQANGPTPTPHLGASATPMNIPDVPTATPEPPTATPELLTATPLVTTD
ncbi:MAG: hypothetical protein P8183_02435, partial [Anaerolineae bacterium]